MSVLRLVATWGATILLWAGPWDPPQAGAQPPSKHRWCLSFHEVHPTLSVAEARRKGVPAGYRIYPAPDGIPWEKELLVREEPFLHGGNVADAQADLDPATNRPIVKFRFDAVGANTFALFTRSNVGRPFAIVVDGSVVTAPTIVMEILGGEGQLSGGLTSDTAAQLADRIRSGTCIEISRLPGPGSLARGIGVMQSCSAPAVIKSKSGHHVPFVEPTTA